MRSSFGFAPGPGDCPRSRKLGTGRQRPRLSEVDSALRLRLRSQSGGEGGAGEGVWLETLRARDLRSEDRAVGRVCTEERRTPAALERKAQM